MKILFFYGNMQLQRCAYTKNTLIKDKEIDYVQILENYIPYALSLGEADIVEEFIKYNEEYRDLIYNRKTMK